jgi:hypothetical protein
MNELRSSPVPNNLSSVPSLICPNCNSSDLQRVSLIHAAGTYESSGRFRGFFFGDGDGLLFGRYQGTSQSRLSKMVGPPRRLPYAAPAILWLLGFFILMAFDGRGKLSWLMGMISAVYILAIPVYFLVALFHNLFVRPKKHKDWERKFMCQRCGALIEAPTATTGRFTSGPFRRPRVKRTWGRVSRGITVRWRGRVK